MSANLVTYTKAAGVASMQLTNPPANAYSYEMFLELDAAILDARMDDDIHVILLSGAGEKFFCAGADIAMLESATPEFKYYFCLHANETLLRLEHTPKLVIAAIEGHCVGGGFEVALAADLRIAKQGRYKLGLPEVNLGVLPGTGGTQRLSRLIGGSRAMELMISGRTFSVDEARDLGVISQVVETDDFDATIREIAHSYCPPRRAAGAVGKIKRAVQTGAALPLESGLALERELQQRLFTAEDAREGIAAFNGKRPPEFKGK